MPDPKAAGQGGGPGSGQGPHLDNTLPGDQPRPNQDLPKSEHEKPTQLPADTERTKREREERDKEIQEMLPPEMSYGYAGPGEDAAKDRAAVKIEEGRAARQAEAERKKEEAKAEAKGRSTAESNAAKHDPDVNADPNKARKDTESAKTGSK